MDHLVYLDAGLLVNDEITLVGGKNCRHIPGGRVHEGDKLFFVEATDRVIAKGRVRDVRKSDNAIPIVDVEHIEAIAPFYIEPYPRREAWLIVGDIHCVKVV